jgi:hypothetical protein
MIQTKKELRQKLNVSPPTFQKIIYSKEFLEMVGLTKNELKCIKYFSPAFSAKVTIWSEGRAEKGEHVTDSNG